MGQGPAIVLVDGALCSRSFGPMPKIAAALAQDFTVFTYDRRGRGDSSESAPYAVEREVEDLAAIVREAGGSAFAFGISSGAVLGLTAAAHGVPITKLVMYEPPFIVDASRPNTNEDWIRIHASLAGGRQSDAAVAFLKAVGVPAVVVAIMRCLPVWSKIKAAAASLPHDGALVQEFQRGEPLPAGRWSTVTIPVFAVDGGRSPAWLRHGTRQLADVLPNVRYRTLEGQTHAVSAKAVVPVLKEFLLPDR